MNFIISILIKTCVIVTAKNLLESQTFRCIHPCFYPFFVAHFRGYHLRRCAPFVLIEKLSDLVAAPPPPIRFWNLIISDREFGIHATFIKSTWLVF